MQTIKLVIEAPYADATTDLLLEGEDVEDVLQMCLYAISKRGFTIRVETVEGLVPYEEYF